MTGLDAVAQWLLGGGGNILRFLLYLIVAWILIGALPRMRRDAAQKVPQVRGTARDRMQEHAVKSAGRGKSAEWWGWTAAWGAISVAAEGARFGRYMVTSAWHGWGDHRRRVKALRERRQRREAPEVAPAPPPPDGGGGNDGGGGGGNRTPEPSRPAAPEPPPDRPAEPPQEAVPPRPEEPPRSAPELQPAASPRVIPFTRKSASESRGEKPVAAEISNLEAAEQVVANMQRKAQREYEAADAEKGHARQALVDADQASADLASAGVKGPVMEAFTNYYEAMQRAEAAAISKAIAAEAALAAANAARGALMAHREAAERLAATGGAADSTAWYGGAGSGGTFSRGTPGQTAPVWPAVNG